MGTQNNMDHLDGNTMKDGSFTGEPKTTWNIYAGDPKIHGTFRPFFLRKLY